MGSSGCFAIRDADCKGATPCGFERDKTWIMVAMGRYINVAECLSTQLAYIKMNKDIHVF